MFLKNSIPHIHYARIESFINTLYIVNAANGILGQEKIE